MIGSMRFNATERRTTPYLLRGRAALAHLLVGLIGLGTLGCDSPRLSDGLHPMVTDPQQRHPIIVAADTASLDMVVLSDRNGLDARSELDVVRFVRKYRQEGKGPLTLWLNSKNSGHRGVSERVNDIQRVAHEAGVGARSFRVRERAGGGVGQQTLTLSYDRIAAIGPQCGDWSESVGRNPENLPYPNYGCASQRNLAAMVARPTDFIYPAQEVERGGERRSGAYRTFRGGDAKSGSAASPAAPTPGAGGSPAAAPAPVTTK
jgi:pilus assembly protein CpaD